ncbi:MAG: hypothetical protein J5952_03140 [Prevotella sp.]|nr:hypothetical protein [Prevotella sp.]
MKTIEVQADQTILDLAVQHYGTADGVGEILRLNPTLENDPKRLAAEGRQMDAFYPDLRLTPGQQVIIDDGGTVIRKSTVKKMTRNVTTYMSKEWQERLLK